MSWAWRMADQKISPMKNHWIKIIMSMENCLKFQVNIMSHGLADIPFYDSLDLSQNYNLKQTVGQTMWQ